MFTKTKRELFSKKYVILQKNQYPKFVIQLMFYCMRHIIPIMITEQRKYVMDYNRDKENQALEALIFEQLIEKDYNYLIHFIEISPPSLVLTYYNVFMSGMLYIDFDFCNENEQKLYSAMQNRTNDCSLFTRRADVLVEVQRKNTHFAAQMQNLNREINAYNITFSCIIADCTFYM